MDLKVIEKSRKLLIQVMGQENFEKFIEDGKIQITHDDQVYELDQDARVYNRTKQESYCIEPLCGNDLPVHDQIAIKFAYLKNNIKCVEEVANKRSTSPVRQVHMGFQGLRMRLAGTNDTELRPEIRETRYGNMEAPRHVGYDSYVEYMEEFGWRRSQITLDERNTRIATIYDVNRNTSHNPVIDITCPAGQKISIMGIQQLPAGCDLRTAHAFRARFANSNDSEIPYETRIRITKERTSGNVVQLASLFYLDINLTTKSNSDLENSPLSYKTDDQWYRFRQGIEFNGEDHLKLYVDNCETDICARNCRLAIDLDLWSM